MIMRRLLGAPAHLRIPSIFSDFISIRRKSQQTGMFGLRQARDILCGTGLGLKRGAFRFAIDPIIDAGIYFQNES